MRFKLPHFSEGSLHLLTGTLGLAAALSLGSCDQNSRFSTVPGNPNSEVVHPTPPCESISAAMRNDFTDTIKGCR